MGHKTLVNGTAYEVSGGKTLVNGTGYEIASGRTLVNGTGYDVPFDVTWKKYNTTATVTYTQNSGTTTEDCSWSQSGGTWTVYDDYSFSSNSGFYGVSGYQASYTYLAGGYYVKSATELLKINSKVGTYNDEYGNSHCKYSCTKYTATKHINYSKGGTSYGTVETPDGEVPEGGTIVGGSLASGKVAVNVGGTVYWYEVA